MIEINKQIKKKKAQVTPIVEVRSPPRIPPRLDDGGRVRRSSLVVGSDRRWSRMREGPPPPSSLLAPSLLTHSLTGT